MLSEDGDVAVALLQRCVGPNEHAVLATADGLVIADTQAAARAFTGDDGGQTAAFAAAAVHVCAVSSFLHADAAGREELAQRRTRARQQALADAASAEGGTPAPELGNTNGTCCGVDDAAVAAVAAAAGLQSLVIETTHRTVRVAPVPKADAFIVATSAATR